MKQCMYRILSFLLSIVIILVSAFFCSFSVYAGGGGTSFDKDLADKFVGNTTWNHMTVAEKWNIIISFLIFDMKAFKNADLESFLNGQVAIYEYINYHDPDEFVTDEGLTIPADLVALIKQALIEYANETNPFKIEQTYGYKTIPASLFPSKQTYSTFLSYCQSHYMVALSFPAQTGYINTNMYLGDVSEVVDDGGGFVANNSTSFYAVNADWSKVPVWCDYYTFVKNDEGEYILGPIQEKKYQCTAFYNYNSTSAQFRTMNTIRYLITKDGGRIRVFNSLAEFKDYNAGQRKVFFGSGFYDFDPTDITATWDEINDKIGRMDDLLQDIIDIITDNPNISEEELEELIDQLIGKIGEIGDKTDETNTILGGISSTLDGITRSLSGYFSSVLSYLEQILAAIKALVWIEADNKLDEDKQDLFDLIDKIWEDPENGSQEAADALTGSFSDVARGLTKKFPFSIPWDIYNLFRVFSGAPAPDEATFHTMTLGAQPFTVDNVDLEQDVHDAPYFKLPLRLDSYGIYEEVVIDLADFKSVSTLGRGLLSVLFAVFLIKFTIKIIELFKGG